MFSNPKTLLNWSKKEPFAVSHFEKISKFGIVSKVKEKALPVLHTQTQPRERGQNLQRKRFRFRKIETNLTLGRLTLPNKQTTRRSINHHVAAKTHSGFPRL